MAGGAGFAMDSIITLRNNKGIRTRRSFLNGVGNDVTFVSYTISKRSTEEEVLFQNRMKAAKLSGIKKEVIMYSVSCLIVWIVFLLLNQVIF